MTDPLRKPCNRSIWVASAAIGTTTATGTPRLVITTLSHSRFRIRSRISRHFALNSVALMQVLPSELRAKIELHVRAGYLAGLPDGPRSFAIIVRAVRGIVPLTAI